MNRRFIWVALAVPLVVSLLVFGVRAARTPKADASPRDQELLSKDPDYAPYLNACKEGRFDDASKLARNLCARSPRNGSAWNAVGYSALREGRHDDAIVAFERAVKLSPGHAKAWHNLGLASGKLGRFEKEERCYRRSIELRPNDASTWMDLAITLRAMEKNREANEAFETAVELDGSYERLRWRDPASAPPTNSPAAAP